MDLWISEIAKLLTWTMGSPTGQVQPIVVGIAGILGFLLILTKVADLLGAGISSAARSFVILVITLVIWIPLAVAANLYIAPKLPSSVTVWLPVACGLLVILAISTPVTRLFQKTKYGKGLLLLLLSVAGAVGVMLLVEAAFGAARSGEEEGGRIKARTGEVNDFLSK